jgi:hypothetical protein
MVCLLITSVVDCGFKSQSGKKTKDYKIGICVFSAKYAALGAKTGWLEISIMCLSGATCLPVDCCFCGISIMCLSGATCLPVDCCFCFRELVL